MADIEAGATPQMKQNVQRVQVNRAAVLTLWAAVVAERFGYDEDEALRVGRAVAYLETYAQGVPFGLGNLRPGRAAEHYRRTVGRQGPRTEVLARVVPILWDEVEREARQPVLDPARVRPYLRDRFGGSLDEVWQTMRELAQSLAPSDLRAVAHDLYRAFRPEVPSGRTGWGACGILDLTAIRALVAPGVRHQA